MKRREKIIVISLVATIVAIGAVISLLPGKEPKESPVPMQKMVKEETRALADWQPEKGNFKNIEVIYSQDNKFRDFKLTREKPFIYADERGFLTNDNYTVSYTIQASESHVIDVELQLYRELVQVKGIAPGKAVKATVGNETLLSIPADWMGNTEFFINKDQLIGNKEICVSLDPNEAIEICHSYYDGGRRNG